MKKVFLNVWKKALVLSLAAITFVITACGEDSGLGSTVDTEAPKIEITYPPLGANMRGTFVLAGNCDDDKSVKSIIITVPDTTTKKVVGEGIPATIENGGKSWKANINNLKDGKYDYLDGNYQFTAEIHDGAGHKNSASRTFDLDNTAPVFVASNPGVIKSQGKKVQINDTLGVDRVVAAFEQEEMKSNPDAYKTASVGLQASDDNSEAYLWKFVGGEEATFLVNQKGYIYAATFQLPNGAYEKHKKELLLFLRKLIVVDVAPDVLEKAVNEVVKGKTTAFFSRNAWRDYVLSYDGQRFVIEAYEAE